MQAMMKWKPYGTPNAIQTIFVRFWMSWGLQPRQHMYQLRHSGRTSPGVIDAAQRLGHSYIVCPWLAEDERTMAHYRDHVALFNEVGVACQEAGIQFAYHNHEFEFEPTEDGVVPYDFMLDETNPELVKMELDLYWIAYANRSVSEYFQRDPGRYPLCHIKDMGPDRGMTPVGDGQIDFAVILAESETAGLRHYFVEHDHPEDALASIRTSITHLRSLTF